MQYPIGTCIYKDGKHNLPWCSLDSSLSNDAYVGAAGAAGANWDYCSCDIGNIYI